MNDFLLAQPLGIQVGIRTVVCRADDAQMQEMTGPGFFGRGQDVGGASPVHIFERVTPFGMDDTD